MDPGTIITVIDVAIKSVEIGIDLYSRGKELKESPNSLPRSLEICRLRLLGLKAVMKQTENHRTSSDEHFHRHCSRLEECLNKLNDFMKKFQNVNNSGPQLLRKAIRSRRVEPEIDKFSKELDSLTVDLNMYLQTKSLSLAAKHDCLDKATKPTARRPLESSYGVPLHHLEKLVGREETLLELKTHLREQSGTSCSISLCGLYGQGKT